MNDDRQVTPPRFLELLGKERELLLARLGRIVVVETDLTPCAERSLRFEAWGLGRASLPDLVPIQPDGADNLRRNDRLRGNLDGERGRFVQR